MAYLEAAAFAEADSEFDLCLKRRGEAAAVLLDDMPTYRFAAPCPTSRAGSTSARQPRGRGGVRAFLAIKKDGDERGLVTDARRRLQKPGA